MDTDTTSANPDLLSDDIEQIIKAWDKTILKMASQARQWKNPLYDVDDVASLLRIEIWKLVPVFDREKSRDRQKWLAKRLALRLKELRRQARRSAPTSIELTEMIELPVAEFGSLGDLYHKRLVLDQAIDKLPPAAKGILTDFRAGYTLTDLAEKSNISRQAAYERVKAAEEKLMLFAESVAA